MVKQEHIDKSISFEAYYQLSDQLAKEGKTTGENQSQSLIDYSKLNFSRMKRIWKTTQILPEISSHLSSIDKKIYWVILTESWCGDAAQNMPILAKMIDGNPNISMHVLLRDENPELMDQYLTNGGKAIPKLIMVDEHLNEINTWGPRPKVLQDWLKKEKENPTMSMDELKKEFQVWYTKDKGVTLQHEMVTLLKGR